MKKKLVVGLSLLMVMMVCGVAVAQADHGMGCQGKGKSGLDKKIFMKAHMLLMNEDELGLTDEQVTKIKNLKMGTKKSLIKQEAEIALLGVDIKSKLWEDTIDVAAITPLVNKKYELKKQKTLSIITAYAQLKNILTAEQKEKMKGLYKKHKGSHKK